MWKTVSIHPPRVGRDGETAKTTCKCGCFNPPSPCGEGQPGTSAHYFVDEFQSTLPVWGGTFGAVRHGERIRVSIHPPRVGRDTISSKIALCSSVSIHPPRVGRDLRWVALIFGWILFQSTLPVWGGTSDRRAASPAGAGFNPPSPCGEGPEQQKPTPT